MLLAPNEQQQMIEASVLELLGERYDAAQRTRSTAAPGGVDAALWRDFAEMGWFGLMVPEADGGIGGGVFDAGLLLRAFGRSLVVEPVHAHALLATRALVLAATPAQRERWLPGLIDGSRRFAFAHEERALIDPWASRTATAVRGADRSLRLHGAKTLAYGAEGADRVLVSASLDGRQAILAVDPAAPGVQMSPYVALDGSRAADLLFDDVALPEHAVLGEDIDTSVALRRVVAEGIIARCWEASGAMAAALEQTAAHTQARQQFGQALAKFQVVQHRIAEMTVQCEEARAACELAALRCDDDPSQVVAMASLAKCKVGRGALFVAQQAVQLHGAMGVSEELPIAATFRKLLAFQHQDGGCAWHTQRYGSRMLMTGQYRASRVLHAVDGAVA